MSPDLSGLGLAGRSASELTTLLSSGEVSAVEVVDAHLDVIGQRNHELNAMCTVDPEAARAHAKRADDAYARSERIGPLHGLPIVHKDVFETAGLRTTYGSTTHRDFVPTQDATVVQRCRTAGAVVLGKTNTPQFATGGHTSNRLFGTTRNPYDPALTAGGSSGGSAAALAAGMSPLATGSDMAGSLRAPAAFCGVVGMRPSPGRVPTWPEPAGDANFSVAGPMARTVDDVALLLSVIAGPDPRVTTSLPEPGVTFWPLPDISGPMRVAWSPTLTGGPVDVEIADVLALVPGMLAAAGARVEEDAPDLRGAREVFEILRASQYAASYAHYLEVLPELLEPLVRANIEAGLAVGASDRQRALTRRPEFVDRAGAFFARYDALIIPGATVMPFPATQWTPDGPETGGGTSYLDWLEPYLTLTVAGLPVVVVPVGASSTGLPVAVQVVAGPGRDLQALQYARLVESLVPSGGLVAASMPRRRDA